MFFLEGYVSSQRGKFFFSLDEGWTLPTKTRCLGGGWCEGCCLAGEKKSPKKVGLRFVGNPRLFFKGKSKLVKYLDPFGQKHVPLEFLWHLAYLKPFKSRFADPSSQPAFVKTHANKLPPTKLIPEKKRKIQSEKFFFFRSEDDISIAWYSTSKKCIFNHQDTGHAWSTN